MGLNWSFRKENQKSSIWAKILQYKTTSLTQSNSLRKVGFFLFIWNSNSKGHLYVIFRSRLLGFDRQKSMFSKIKKFQTFPSFTSELQSQQKKDGNEGKIRKPYFSGKLINYFHGSKRIIQIKISQNISFGQRILQQETMIVIGGIVWEKQFFGFCVIFENSEMSDVSGFSF